MIFTAQSLADPGGNGTLQDGIPVVRGDNGRLYPCGATGMSEHEIAGSNCRKSSILRSAGYCQPGGDGRKYFSASLRDPLLTTKKLEKYAMLVLCGRRGGRLGFNYNAASILKSSRGNLTSKEKACVYIDAGIYLGLRVLGATLGEVIEREAASL